MSFSSEGINQLSVACREIVIRLMEHPALKRLATIRQLGFSSREQTTRMEHTLRSIECAARFMHVTQGFDASAQSHFIAAIAVEDIGRAPFSNSLDRVFTSLPGMSPDRRPIDVERSIAIVRHLERTERILSSQGLVADLVVDIMRGNIPWPRARKLRSLIDGALDIDRLSYVRGDTAAAEHKNLDIAIIAQGMYFDGEAPAAVIDASAVSHVVDFIIQRTKLYLGVYYEADKLAIEAVVRQFMKKLWSAGEFSADHWEGPREPRTIDSFLTWTDDTVLDIFCRPCWAGMPADLERLRSLLSTGALGVSEVRLFGNHRVDLEEIERRLGQIEAEIASRPFHWVLRGDDLPSMSAYERGTVLVRRRSTHDDLANTPEMRSQSELLESVRRAPLLVYPTSEIAALQTALRNTELVISTTMPLDWIQLQLQRCR